MSRASRYEEQKPKLNIKKVIGTIVTLIVLVAIVLGIVYAINEGQNYRVRRAQILHYFTSFDEKTQKYGVIDASGNVVIENKYDELILIPNKEKDVFLVTEDVDYEKGKYTVKALNKNGNEILKGYEELKPIEYIADGVQYDANVLQFKKDKKYGFVTYEGNETFKAVFDEVKTMPSIPNRLIVKEDGKYGVINTETSTTIIPSLFKVVQPIAEEKNTGYMVKFAEKYGVYNSVGKEILPSEYDSITKINSPDFFKATKNKVTNIYNKEGKVAVKGDVSGIQCIRDNLIVNKKNGKVGAINFDKKEVIPYKYQEIISASVDKYIVRTAGKYNVRTSKKDKLLEKDYNSIVYNLETQMYIASNDSFADIYDLELELKLQGIISEIDLDKGVMKVYKDEELKIYNFQFEEETERSKYPENNLNIFKNEEGKYGFINDKDKVIVEAIYDDAKMQNKYGFIAVSKDNKWGVLDYNGSVILEPVLDLSDHLVIDFIKDWNFDKDITLNVYTKSIVPEAVTE